MPASPASRESAGEVVNPSVPAVDPAREAEERAKAETEAEVSVTLGVAPGTPPPAPGLPVEERESAASMLETAIRSHMESSLSLSEGARVSLEEAQRITQEKAETKRWFRRSHDRLVLAQDALEQRRKIKDGKLTDVRMGTLEYMAKSFMSKLSFGYRRWITLIHEHKGVNAGAEMLGKMHTDIKIQAASVEGKKQEVAALAGKVAAEKQRLSEQKTQLEHDVDLQGKKGALEAATQREQALTSALARMKEARDQAADLKRRMEAETDGPKKVELEQQLGAVKQVLLTKMQALRDAGVVPNTKAVDAQPGAQPTVTKAGAPEAGKDTKVEMTAEEKKAAESQLDALKNGIAMKENASKALDAELGVLRTSRADLEKKLAPPAAVDTKEKKAEEKEAKPETVEDPEAVKKIEEAKKTVDAAKEEVKKLSKDADASKVELDAAQKEKEEADAQLAQAEKEISEKQSGTPKKEPEFAYQSFYPIDSSEGQDVLSKLPADQEVSLLLGTQKPGEHAEFVGKKSAGGLYEGTITVTVGDKPGEPVQVKNAGISAEKNGWWQITPKDAPPYVFYDISKKEQVPDADAPATADTAPSDALNDARDKAKRAAEKVDGLTTKSSEAQGKVDGAKARLSDAERHLGTVSTPKPTPPGAVPGAEGSAPGAKTDAPGSAEIPVTGSPKTDAALTKSVEAADPELDEVDAFLAAGNGALLEARTARELAAKQHEDATAKLEYVTSDLGKLDALEKKLQEQKAGLDAWLSTTLDERTEAVFKRIQTVRGGQIGKAKVLFGQIDAAENLKKEIRQRLELAASSPISALDDSAKAFRKALGTNKRIVMSLLDTVATVGFVKGAASQQFGNMSNFLARKFMGADAVSLKGVGFLDPTHAAETITTPLPVDHTHITDALTTNTPIPDTITPEGTLWDTIQHHGGAAGEQLTNAETLARQQHVVDAINGNPELVKMLGHELTVTPDAFGQFGSAGKLTAEQLSTLVSDPNVAQAIHGSAAEQVQAVVGQVASGADHAVGIPPGTGPVGSATGPYDPTMHFGPKPSHLGPVGSGVEQAVGSVPTVDPSLSPVSPGSEQIAGQVHGAGAIDAASSSTSPDLSGMNTFELENYTAGISRIERIAGDHEAAKQLILSASKGLRQGINPADVMNKLLGYNPDPSDVATLTEKFKSLGGGYRELMDGNISYFGPEMESSATLLQEALKQQDIAEFIARNGQTGVRGLGGS